MKVTANTYRSEGWWVVELEEFPSVFTQTKRLDQIEEEVRDALALVPDLMESPDDIVVEINLTDEIGESSRAILEKIAQAKQAEKEANDSLVLAAKKLSEQKIPYRDIGHIFGVSHQYVQKLVTR